MPCGCTVTSILLPHSQTLHAATLFVVGSYHIGKERAYLGAAAALGWRVHCTPAKHRVSGWDQQIGLWCMARFKQLCSLESSLSMKRSHAHRVRESRALSLVSMRATRTCCSCCACWAFLLSGWRC